MYTVDENDDFDIFAEKVQTVTNNFVNKNQNDKSERFTSLAITLIKYLIKCGKLCTYTGIENDTSKVILKSILMSRLDYALKTDFYELDKDV